MKILRGERAARVAVRLDYPSSGAKFLSTKFKNNELEALAQGVYTPSSTFRLTEGQVLSYAFPLQRGKIMADLSRLLLLPTHTQISRCIRCMHYRCAHCVRNAIFAKITRVIATGESAVDTQPTPHISLYKSSDGPHIDICTHVLYTYITYI